MAKQSADCTTLFTSPVLHVLSRAQRARARTLRRHFAPPFSDACSSSLPLDARPCYPVVVAATRIPAPLGASATRFNGAVDASLISGSTRRPPRSRIVTHLRVSHAHAPHDDPRGCARHCGGARGARADPRTHRPPAVACRAGCFKLSRASNETHDPKLETTAAQDTVHGGRRWRRD